MTVSCVDQCKKNAPCDQSAVTELMSMGLLHDRRIINYCHSAPTYTLLALWTSSPALYDTPIRIASMLWSCVEIIAGIHTYQLNNMYYNLQLLYRPNRTLFNVKREPVGKQAL